MGPREGGGALARVAVAPIFPSSAAMADFGLTIDRVRIIVIRPVSDTLADTTAVLPPDADFLDLNLRVPLRATSESLSVTIEALAGSVPLFSGTSMVEVRTDVATPAPIEIPVTTYIGPGAGVDSIVVQPRSPFIYLNDSLRLQVQAFQGGAPVTQFYVSWSTSDTTIARINGFGVLRAPAIRTAVRVRARTPSGVSDSVPATFVPVPTQLAVSGGDGQSGSVGQVLETPLEVEVRAADGLPVGGVAVRFRALTGGLPADTTVIADGAGRARVVATLGSAIGPQSFEASVPGFASIAPVSFAATALAGTISAATSVVTVATGTIASGSDVILTLIGKDANSNAVTTGGATVVFTASGGTSTGNIGTVTDNGNGTYSAPFTGVLAGTATTIGATIDGQTVTTTLPAITVVPGPVTTVTVSPSTASLAALGATEKFTAEARDTNGNVVATSVTWSATPPGIATIDADGLATAVGNGSATVVATAGGVADSVSLIVSQVATRLAFTVEPSTAAAGIAIAPAVVITAVDSLGTAVAAFTDSVTVAIGANPSGGVLSGTLTHPSLLGGATFDDLQIDQPGSGYTLVATAAGVAADTSAAFVIAAPAATTFWTNAAGGNWSDPANWSGGLVPALGDTAVIDLAGTYSVVLDVNDSVGGLRIGGSTGLQTLAVGATRTLGVGGAMMVGVNGAVDATSATINGTGLLTNAGTMRLRAATVAKPLANEATLLADGSNTINGALTTTASSFIRIQGNGQTGFSQMTVAIGFSNAGRIELTDTGGAHGARLTVSGGVLINASTGVIEAMPGALGTRELALMLHNQGTLTVSHTLQLNQSGADHQNSGTIVVSGGNLTLVQSGTTPSFATTGVVRIDAGRALVVNSGVFDYTSGSLEGRGTLSLNTATANFAPAFSNDTLALTLTTSVLNGPGTVTITAGDTLRARSSTIAAPLVLQGVLLFDGTNNVSGSFTVDAGAKLRIQGNGQTGFSQLTAASGFTNSGTIELTDTSGAHGARLTVSSGALINAAGGVIEAAPGAGGIRDLVAVLDNQAGGTIAVSHNLALNRASASHQNAGTISIAGGNLALNQSGTAPSFTTSGSITIAAGRAFAVSSGTFNYAGGSIGGLGTLALSSLTANFTQSFSNDTLVLTLTTSTLNGPGTLTVTPDDTLRVRSSTIAAPLVLQGALLFDGSNNVSGSFTIDAGAKLRIQGNGQTGFSQLTAASGFTNSGTIELTDTSGAHGARLTVTSGALVNAVGGVIEAAPGAGGIRELTAALDNQAGGTLALSHNLALNRASANHQNAGTVSITGGNLTLNQSGTTPSFATSGTVTIAAGRSFNVSGGTFDYAGGSIGGLGTLAFTAATVNFAQSFSNDTLHLVVATSTLNGPGTLTVTPDDTLRVRSSTIAAPLVNQGVLLFDGTSSITGSFTTATGSRLRVQGNGQTGFSQLTVANGFTNSGTVELTDSSGAHGARLAVSAGTLVNASGGVIAALPGAGGSRQLSATLDNQAGGTVAVDHSFTLNGASAAHSNGGTITVASGTLTLNQSGTTPTFTTGGSIVIESGTAFVVNAGTFDYTGGTVGGRGALSLNNVVVNLTPSFTVDTLDVSLLSATINGPGTFTVAAGRTLPVRSSIFNGPLVNQGSVLVGGGTAVNGLLTAAGGSLLRIQGNGQVGSSQLTVATTGGFTNDGQLLLTDSSGAHGATLIVSGGPLVNGSTGIIRADTGAGGTRTLSATIDNRGTFQVALNAGQVLTTNVPSAAHVNSGVLLIESGTFTVTGAGSSLTNASTGRISGEGTFNTTGTSFTNTGAVDPGSPPGGAGILTVSGAYTQTSGTLQIQLGGASAGAQHDQLAVSGGSALDGTLSVSLIDGFTPVVGDTFVVLTYGSRTGTFATLTGTDLGGGVTLDTVFRPTYLVLQATVPRTATRLVFVQQPPSPIFFGDTFTVQVAAQDDSGNIVTSFNNRIVISENAGSTDSLAKLQGPVLDAFAVNGVATFTGLFVDATDTTAIDAIADGLVGATSVTFEVVDQIVLQGTGAAPYFAGVDTLTNRVYVTNTAGSSATVVDGETNKVVNDIGGLGTNPGWEGLHPETRRVFITDFVEGGLYVIDGSQDAVVDVISVGPSITQPVVNVAGDTVYVPARTGVLSLAVVDIAGRVIDRAIQIGQDSDTPAGTVLDTATGLVWVVIETQSSIKSVDPAGGRVVDSIFVGELPYGIALDPVARRLYVTVSGQAQVFVLDLVEKVGLQPITVGATPQGISVDPKTGRVFVANYEDGVKQGTISVIDGGRLEVIKAITVGVGPGDAEFNPRNGLVYVPNGIDNSISIVKPN